MKEREKKKEEENEKIKMPERNFSGSEVEATRIEEAAIHFINNHPEWGKRQVIIIIIIIILFFSFFRFLWFLSISSFFPLSFILFFSFFLCINLLGKNGVPSGGSGDGRILDSL